MNDESIEQTPVLDLPWLLAGSFLVLLAGFAFILFSMVFVAGLDDVRFLGDVAAFVLIFAVAVFAVFIFVAANEGEPEGFGEYPVAAQRIAPEMSSEAPEQAAAPGACPACGQVNPEGANFCYSCGQRLARS
jgi:hypothetical protein